MTIPYPLIGLDTYGLGRSARQSPRSIGSSRAGSVSSDAKPNDSHEHMETYSKSSSTSVVGWKARLLRKFHFA
ncbi:hypothetical protein BO71DRAFT_398583 [Aspergillus ellipticus CBS 707.79]|uniref:Uncharacterized protein n=1 Tax=Aspergillus ellipticus CBS 707.79 TaxID=1448320 RepID=A0A319DBZ4_9EURO|nr:hypothetical protein BO71DRAFT_398583 [Aspergillus ellipticus CBS 707.79]